MKAVYFDEHGGPEVLKYTDDYPAPGTKPGYVLVKVHSTSVNRIDLVVRNGYPGMNLSMPHIPGGDIAGTVVSCGKGVDNFETGDRVVSYPIVLPDSRDPKFGEMEFLNDGWEFFGMQRPGSYCEYIAVPAEGLIKISDKLSFADAAALPIAGITAYHAVETAELKVGDLFMIWGGSGGLGNIAVQLAAKKGATVITTVGKDEKIDLMRELGAHHVFNHNREDVAAEVRKMFPKGVDAIIDYVGPATFDSSFSLLSKNGKIIFCGMLTGMEVKLNIQQTYFRHLNIHGIYLGSLNEFRELVKLAEAGEVKPHIDRVVPLKDAAKAHEIIMSGDYIGKIVLEI